MKDLTNLEAALLLSVKMHASCHAVYHAGAINATILEVDRTYASLNARGLIAKDVNNKFYLLQNAVDRLNKELTKETENTGVVHTSKVEPAKECRCVKYGRGNPHWPCAVHPDEVQDKQEAPALVLPKRPTEESILAQLAHVGEKGTTATELAKPYGIKGTSLVQTLIRLRETNRVVKNDKVWALAKAEDAVTHIEVPYDARREITEIESLKAVINVQRGWFTMKDMFAELSKAYKINADFFHDVFMGMAENGEFNVMEDGVLVDYTTSYSYDNKHSPCLHAVDAKLFEMMMRDYVYLIKQGGAKSFSLSHAVNSLRLRSDMVLHWFELAGFNVEDPALIREAGTEFRTLDNVSVMAICEFIDTGVKLSAFIKHFKLDPSTAEDVKHLLQLTKTATFHEETQFLVPFAPPLPLPVEEPEIIDHGPTVTMESIEHGCAEDADEPDEEEDDVLDQNENVANVEPVDGVRAVPADEQSIDKFHARLNAQAEVLKPLHEATPKRKPFKTITHAIVTLLQNAGKLNQEDVIQHIIEQGFETQELLDQFCAEIAAEPSAHIDVAEAQEARVCGEALNEIIATLHATKGMPLDTGVTDDGAAILESLHSSHSVFPYEDREDLTPEEVQLLCDVYSSKVRKIKARYGIVDKEPGPQGHAGHAGPVGPTPCNNECGTTEPEMEKTTVVNLDKSMWPYGLHREIEVVRPLPVPNVIDDIESLFYGCEVRQCVDPRFATVMIPEGFNRYDIVAIAHRLVITRNDKGYATVQDTRANPTAVRKHEAPTTPANKPAQQTVKPEWTVGLSLIAENHKKGSTTRKLLLEIKEHLEK